MFYQCCHNIIVDVQPKLVTLFISKAYPSLSVYPSNCYTKNVTSLSKLYQRLSSSFCQYPNQGCHKIYFKALPEVVTTYLQKFNSQVVTLRLKTNSDLNLNRFRLKDRCRHRLRFRHRPLSMSYPTSQ